MNLSNDFLTFCIKIAVGFEVLAAIFATFFYYKYKNVIVLKHYVLILWYVVFNEFFGLYIRLNTDYSTALIHNIYNVIHFSFLFILFKNHLNHSFHKKITFISLIVYWCVLIVNGFYENYLIEFQRLPYIIAACSIVTIILLYFQEILNSDKVLHVNKNLLFWISVGLLIYYVGNIPFRILRNYYEYLTDATISTLVNIILGITMYACFIIGFVWSDKK